MFTQVSSLMLCVPLLYRWPHSSTQHVCNRHTANTDLHTTTSHLTTNARPPKSRWYNAQTDRSTGPAADAVGGYLTSAPSLNQHPSATALLARTEGHSMPTGRSSKVAQLLLSYNQEKYLICPSGARDACIKLIEPIQQTRSIDSAMVPTFTASNQHIC